MNAGISEQVVFSHWLEPLACPTFLALHSHGTSSFHCAFEIEQMTLTLQQKQVYGVTLGLGAEGTKS